MSRWPFDQQPPVFLSHRVGAHRLVGGRCERLSGLQAEAREVTRADQLAILDLAAARSVLCWGERHSGIRYVSGRATRRQGDLAGRRAGGPLVWVELNRNSVGFIGAL
jgi:hypothetical protein